MSKPIRLAELWNQIEPLCRLSNHGISATLTRDESC